MEQEGESVIDNMQQLIDLAKLCPELKFRVYPYMTRGIPLEFPYAAIEEFGHITGHVNSKGERDARLSYALHVYSDTQEDARRISEIITDIYIKYNITVNGRVSIYNDGTQTYEVRTNHTYGLDINGWITR